MSARGSLVKVQTACLAVIATVLVTYMIFWLRPILIPFVVAVFVVSGVAPMLDMLEYRLSVSRPIAAAIAFLFGLLVIILLVFFLWLSVWEMAQQGPAYRKRINSLVASAEKFLDAGWLNWRLTDFMKPSPETEAKPSLREEENAEEGIAGEEVEQQYFPLSSTASSGETVDRLRSTIDRWVRDGLATLSAELFRLLTTSVVVLIYVFFLLLGAPKLRNEKSAFHRINLQVRSYLSLKTTISIFTGGLVGLTLWLFNVPMALTFGLLAFLLNYIPNIGPIVASLLPIPFILLHPDATWWWMILTIGSVSAIQLISGNIVEPKLMGDTSGLHPVTILLSLMFWGMMWGITGMFLAIPITAGMKIILEGIPSTQPLADVMAGRWEAATSFVQEQ